jgi:ferredoxin-NADP reductase
LGRAGICPPKNPSKKLVFIAGGIGITPFRSMIKYLLDTQKENGGVGEKRSIVLFYSNKTILDIAYKDLLDEARVHLGIKTIYAINDFDSISNYPLSSNDLSGMRKAPITEKMIREEVPNYAERMFYLSGPHSMVIAFEKILLNMGIEKGNIKKDFFPGFA